MRYTFPETDSPARPPPHTHRVLGDHFVDVLGAAQEGDTEAFAALWDATQPMLLRYLRVRAGEHAEDVASETWINVINGLHRFAGDEPGFRRWVVTIARNTHVDLLRRLGRRPELAVADLTELGGQPSATDVAAVVEGHDDTRRALALVATLPPDQAEMVLLRVLVGMDVADVAAVTGRSPGAVRVAVHRALRRLRDTLAAGDGAVTGPALTTFSGRDV